MKNKKQNKKITIITIIIIIIIAIISFLVIAFNSTKTDNDLSIVEKNYLTDLANQVVSVDVFNNVPVFGNSGKGVVFDFLNKFSEDYGIQFNEKSYIFSSNTSTDNLGDTAFKVLTEKNELEDSSIVLYEDYYVLLGSMEENTITDIKSITDTIGILAEDEESIKYHLSEITYKTYDNVSLMLDAYNNKEISYLILPNLFYMDKIVENNLNILYHISDINYKYVLNVKDEKLNEILTKYYKLFKNDGYEDSFGANFKETYFNNSTLTESEKMNYNSTVYTYGYVTNMPFEGSINNKFVGIVSNYLSNFMDDFNVEFKFVKYASIDKLLKDYQKGNIDIALANFDYSDFKDKDKYIYTNNVISNNYVILSKNYLNIRDITSIKDYKVATIKDSYLYNIAKEKELSIKKFNNSDELIRDLDSKYLILTNKEVYNYYKNEKLANYNIVYEEKTNGYSFIINNSNKGFYELFKYYVSYLDYNDYYTSYNSYEETGMTDYTMIYVIALCLVIVVVLFITKVILINKGNKKASSIDDKAKYIDLMTSLKNRNYLNYSIPKWDENVIYPQAIIMIDLNNIKKINDNYGVEKGDEIIKKAASTLIANQIEKTDLIRTDGNEFLIYMVGYEEEKVVDYIRVLYKEFKELPYGFGATFGYSMIEDDVKSIEDAINEAIIDLNNNKNK